MSTDMRDVLEAVQIGSLSIDQALESIRMAPFQDIGYAKVDMHRAVRQGMPEVIYGASKTPDQIIGIVGVLRDAGQEPILITRLDATAAAEVKHGVPDLVYHEQARIASIGAFSEPDGLGTIVVATGGTSDIPVAEEAALSAEAAGNDVLRLYDVGVAGLHRTLSHMEELMEASVIVAVAGMEGALASVIGGLVNCPVIAVPTSVGYGASFGGIAALLSMLNSCATGVSVVNIDNGFGAGMLAGRINHMHPKD